VCGRDGLGVLGFRGVNGLACGFRVLFAALGFSEFVVSEFINDCCCGGVGCLCCCV
jgi:hypothetical protein